MSDYHEKNPKHGRDPIPQRVPTGPRAKVSPLDERDIKSGDQPMNIETTLASLHTMVTEQREETKALRAKVESMTDGLTPEQIGDSSMAKTIDSYEKRLSPWRKVWATTVILGTFCTLVFGAGVTYQQVKGGLATKDDIAEHKRVALDPVIADVETITRI